MKFLVAFLAMVILTEKQKIAVVCEMLKKGKGIVFRQNTGFVRLCFQ
jgi:hypothetical protein